MKKNPINATQQSEILNSLLFKVAKQTVYTSLKTIHAKSPTPEITNLQNQLYNINSNINNTSDNLQDVTDLIQVATLTIIKVHKQFYKNIISLENMLTLSSYYYNIPLHNYRTGKHATPFLITCKAVNKYIYSQKSNKGRKTITTATTIQNSNIITYNSDNTIKKIETSEPQKFYQSGYKIEFISLDSHIESPENFNNLTIDFRVSQELEYTESYAKIISLLSKTEKQIFSLLQHGYSQTKIANTLKVKQQSVYVMVKRIRQKIANSEYFNNYDIIDSYKTIQK